jgi:glutathione S-transferase
VLAVATSTFFVNTFHVLLTSKFRKASGLKYPIAYATPEQAEKDRKAYMFNCGMCLPECYPIANNYLWYDDVY